MDKPTIVTLQQTIVRLRGEHGCPWDKKQTPETLIKYIRNETEELIEAIKNNDIDNTCEELGDVLYLLCMISAINKERGNFTFTQVIQGINEKLIRRHPHVFANATYKDEDDLNRQWEAIKAEEKKGKKKLR